MIRLDGVHKAFGQVLAVSDITFAVERHTAVSLTGPSGSGKTTLLRLIAGLEEPDAGEISLDGQIVSRPGAVTAPHTRSIGMVFQASGTLAALDRGTPHRFRACALGARSDQSAPRYNDAPCQATRAGRSIPPPTLWG